MKKFVSLILCTALILCFVGCQTAPAATPTDTQPTVVSGASDDPVVPTAQPNESEPEQPESEPEQPESEAASSAPVQTVQPQPSQAPVPSTPAAPKPASSKSASSKSASSKSAASKPAASNPAASKPAASQVEAAEPVSNDPGFKTVEELENWLKSNAAKTYFSEDTYNLISDGQTVHYSVPANIDGFPHMYLHGITVDNFAIGYWFEFNDLNPERTTPICYLFCNFGAPHALDNLFESVRSGVEAGSKTASIREYNGIEYYCNEDPSNKEFNIYWKQFGNSYTFHCSTWVTKYTVDADDLIPYLTVETVTLPLK